MELKKSYKGLIIMFVVLLAVVLVPCFLPYSIDITAGDIIRSIDILGVLWITALTYVIYKTEYVYWYNGTSYEDAVKAGSERRKAFAYEHFRRFRNFAMFAVAFTVIMALLEYFTMKDLFWIDLIACWGGICVIAIGTVKIKL